MGVQFFKNIFIALFHLSKGLDHYENLKRIFPIFSLLFLFFSQISQESRGVKTMNRKLKQPGLIITIVITSLAAAVSNPFFYLNFKPGAEDLD